MPPPNEVPKINEFFVEEIVETLPGSYSDDLAAIREANAVPSLTFIAFGHNIVLHMINWKRS